MEEVKSASSESDLDGNQGPSAAGEAAADTVEVSDLAQQLAAVTEERDKLEAEKKTLADRLVRFQAEFDNFRKRVDRERMELLEFASMDAVRNILPMTDDFERALRSEVTDKEFVRGLEMIYQRLMEALTKLGLQPIPAEGEKFDPNLHHAVNKEQSEEYEEDAILEEYQKGYYFKGRVLRPAMVKVAVKP
jgi:molecular chaperone GrpE